MQARNPALDFSNVSPRWGRNIEFVHMLNGSSINAVQVEIYLNSVMTQALRMLDPARKELMGDVRLFVRQEANHCKQHSAFNKRIYSEGYPEVSKVEAGLKADLTSFLQARSHRFNMAYSAGFENIALFTAQYIFAHADTLFAGCDPQVAELWKWHLAEEYEHRSVVHDAYAVLYGNYFWRIYGLLYAFRHLKHFSSAARKIMMETDRATMTDAEREESIAREKKLKRANIRFVLPRILKIMMPFYNPERQDAPKGVEHVLARHGQAQPAI